MREIVWVFFCPLGNVDWSSIGSSGGGGGLTWVGRAWHDLVPELRVLLLHGAELLRDAARHLLPFVGLCSGDVLQLERLCHQGSTGRWLIEVSQRHVGHLVIVFNLNGGK